jgi:hypothetical protein
MFITMVRCLPLFSYLRNLNTPSSAALAIAELAKG